MVKSVDERVVEVHLAKLQARRIQPPLGIYNLRGRGACTSESWIEIGKV